MLTFSARSDRDNPAYTAPEAQQLAVSCTAAGGDGSPEAPFLQEVTVRNAGDAPWSGVLRLDLSFGAPPVPDDGVRRPDRRGGGGVRRLAAGAQGLRRLRV